MAFNADLQVLTQPGSIGNQTYSLASNFDPKAVILWATPQAADGNAVHWDYGMGFGTYRGAAVQQRWVVARGLDAAGLADTARGAGQDALLVLLTDSAASAVRNLEIDLVSMQTGATSEVVLAWNNLHSTASIRVFMLVLGGSAITDALVGDMAFSTATTTQDETVVAGFGKPELLFFLRGALADAEAAANAQLGFGFAKQGEAGRCFSFGQTDGNTASITAIHQRSDRCFIAQGDGSSAAESIAQLNTTVSSWPTDGFRLTTDANPLDVHTVRYLALRTTAQITTGANTAPTAGGLPVTQDNAAGFVPKLGLLFGWNLAANAAMQTAAADQVGVGIGAYDGATEAWAGFTEDDAALTMVADMQQSTAKVIQNFAQGNPPPVQSAADGVFSGNNFRLSWTDIDTVARQYQWLAIGDPAGPATLERAAALAATAALASQATFFSILERATTLAATAGIASVATFLSILERSLVLNATAGIAASGTFLTVFERASALAATGAIASSGVVSPGATVHTRAAALGATGSIATAGSFLSVFERSGALAATGAIATDSERVLLRSAVLNANAALASAATFLSILERSAALAATATIVSEPERVLLRSAALTAATAPTVSGEIAGAVQRSASLSAVGAILTDSERELLRRVALNATGALSASGQIGAARSASLQATGAITASGSFYSILEGSASLSALADVSAAGSTVAPESERAVSFTASAGIAVAGIGLAPPPPGYIDFPGIGLITRPVGGSQIGAGYLGSIPDSGIGSLAQTTRGVS